MKKEAWEKEQPRVLRFLDILGYLPPVVFIVLSEIASFYAGVIIALLYSIVLTAIISRKGNLKAVHAVFPIFFSGCIIVLYAFPIHAGILMRYRGALLWGSFAVMAFASLIVRSPFTLLLAKEQVIEAVWDTPVFVSVNYVLTWIFAIVFSTNMMMNAIWENILTVHFVSFGLLIAALISTIALPARYVPWYMKKYGAKARPKDLSKLPLRMIFEGMVAGFNAEAAKGWDTVIQYNITGEGGEKFYVEMKDQKCSLSEGEAADPKLTITVSKEDWVAIAEGKLEGQKAFMEGKIRAEGDMNDVLRMQEVFSGKE